MKFKINFEYLNGTEDSFVVEAPDIQQVREIADKELAKRGGVNPWSEQLD